MKNAKKREAVYLRQFTHRGIDVRMTKKLGRDETWWFAFKFKGRRFRLDSGERGPVRAQAAAKTRVEWTKHELAAAADATKGPKAMKQRPSPAEVQDRVGGLLRRLIDGGGTCDERTLQMLEEVVTLPPELRKYRGRVSVFTHFRRPVVYLLVSLGRVVYIGQSQNVLSRLKDHQQTRTFDSVYVLSCNLLTMNRLERHLISKFPDADNLNQGLRVVHSGPFTHREVVAFTDDTGSDRRASDGNGNSRNAL